MSLKFTLEDYLIMDGIFEHPDDNSQNETKKENEKKEKMEANRKYLTEKKTKIRKDP